MKIRSLGYFQILVLVSILLCSNISVAQLSTPLLLPNNLIKPSTIYDPPLLKGMIFQDNNPFQIDFIVDSGKDPLDDTDLKVEIEKLSYYFLSALAIPEEEMWVNLSPYEQNRIIPATLGRTAMGHDLLAQDYTLKQLSSSMLHPDLEFGQKFWDTIHNNLIEKYGTMDIPLNTFNKIWIVPEKAVVDIRNNSVFIRSAKLKVMLEDDYLALEANLHRTDHGVGEIPEQELDKIQEISTGLIRDVLLPDIEREVNEGELFSTLRQIYHSMILASWYKRNVKNSIINQYYSDRSQTSGIQSKDLGVPQEIYATYMSAFKDGVFNFVKEEYDPISQEIIPRKYFSGGVDTSMLGESIENPTEIARQEDPTANFAGPAIRASIVLNDAPQDTQEVYFTPTTEAVLGTEAPNVDTPFSKDFSKMIVTEEQTRFVPDVIMLLFEIADELGLKIALTGGTARDFVVAVKQSTLNIGKKNTLPKLTDVDIVIEHTPKEDDLGLYNEKGYNIFQKRLGERLSELGYTDRDSEITHLDWMPGTLIGDTYVFQNIMNNTDAGSAFSINKLAVEKVGDKFLIFGIPEVLSDVRTSTLDFLGEDKPFSITMMAKMLARGIMYKETAEFNFNERSQKKLAEDLSGYSLQQIQELLEKLGPNSQRHNEDITVAKERVRQITVDHDMENIFQLSSDDIVAVAFGEKTIEGASKNVGGIDLNANILNLDENGKFTFSFSQDLNIEFLPSGNLRPAIYNIQPYESIWANTSTILQ
ncbi:MAG: hypothetical protein A2267_08275 [Omnitrophica WOR_2 bacterium RIFOXYA12_FULL_38_10]|nr:MAG: hypothetical protein A2267_08275 [Omnitrophica WOR_2 bacterium RIFOXYA12_FULL_38_10]